MLLPPLGFSVDSDHLRVGEMSDSIWSAVQCGASQHFSPPNSTPNRAQRVTDHQFGSALELVLCGSVGVRRSGTIYYTPVAVYYTPSNIGAR
jgi:hypothetical protein